MVITLLLPLLLVLITYLMTLVPAQAVPSLSALPGVASELAGYVGSFSNWLPGEVLAPCLTFVFACFTVSVTVRFARVVIAHLPFIGGESGG